MDQAQAQATRNPQVPDRPQVFDPELAAETETASTDLLESSIVASYKYKPPGASSSSSFSFSSSSNSLPPPRPVEWVCNPSDGSVLLDHKGKPVSVDKLLTTKPLRHDLSSRPGPGGKKLTYISGEGVSRTLNDIFGFDGWNIDITQLQREECLKENGRYTVVYTAMVKLTHRKTGAYKVDAGVGDSTDKSFATAVGHAMKSSITDAMKRAARHFGDKLGNCKYT